MSIGSLGTATVKTQLDTAGLRAGFKTAERDAEASAGRIKRSLSGIGASLRNLGTSLPAIVGTGGLVYGLQSVAKYAQQAEVGMRLFEKQLTLNNQSVAAGTTALKGIADELGLVPQTIADSATQLLRQGLSMKEIVTLFRGAGASALAAGKSTASGVDAVTQAVVNQQSIYLNYAGIAQNLNVSYQEQAKALGKASTELTTLEKAQAAVNLVQSATAQEVASLPDLLSGYTGATNDLTKAVSEAKIQLGDFAKGVLTPIITTATTGLRTFNDLPGPVKRVGIAAAGAAIGVTALATGLGVVYTAALPLLGPAGIFIGAAAVIGGVAAALAGGQGLSLKKAVNDAKSAMADVKSFQDFQGALTQLGNQLTSPAAKKMWEDYRAGIDLTGDSLDALTRKMQGAMDYFTRLQAYQELSGQAAGAVLNAAIPTSGPSFQQQAMAAVREGDYAKALQVVKGVRSDLLSVGTLTKREKAEFDRLIADLTAAKTGFPPPDTGDKGKPTPKGAPKGTPNDPVTVTLSQPSATATVNTGFFSTNQPPAAALKAAKGGNYAAGAPMLLNGYPASSLPSFRDYLQAANDLQASEAFRAAREGSGNLAADQLKGIAKGALSLYNDALTAGKTFGGWFLDGVKAVQGEADRQATARLRADMQALVEQDARDAARAANDAAVSAAFAPARELNAAARQSAEREAALTLQTTTKGIYNFGGELDNLRQKGSDAAQATAELARQERALAATLQGGPARMTPGAVFSTDLALGINAPTRVNRYGVAPALTTAQQGQLTMQQGAPGMVFTREQTKVADEAAKAQIDAAKKAAAEQKAAADRFKLTIVSSAGEFAQALISGSPGGIVTGGLGAAGGIISAIPNFAAGPLVGSIVGTVGSVLGSLFGLGGSNTASENAAAARAARANATPPALDLTFEVNQNYKFDAFNDPQSQAQMRSLINDMFKQFEQTIAKTIVPRLDRQDRALGLT